MPVVGNIFPSKNHQEKLNIESSFPLNCQVMQSRDPSAREIILSNMTVAFDRILLDVKVSISIVDCF